MYPGQDGLATSHSAMKPSNAASANYPSPRVIAGDSPLLPISLAYELKSRAAPGAED